MSYEGHPCCSVSQRVGRRKSVESGGGLAYSSSAAFVQVKNGRQVAAAPGPAQIENLPDPCASALNIPKARSKHFL